MITGDIKDTAKSIAKQIRIIHEDDSDSNTFNSGDFDRLPENEQNSILSTAIRSNSGLVFARSEPKHKRSLIKLLSNLVYRYY